MRLLGALKDTVLGIGSIAIFAALLASCGGGGGGKEKSSDPTDATLADLVVTPGTLSPAFSPAVIAYATDVIADTTSIDVTGTVAAANATMAVGGAPVASGVAHTVPLPIVGPNPIQVVVLAANGTTTKTYTITVTRPSISLTPLSSNVLASGTATLLVRLADAAGVGGTVVTLNATSPAGVPATVTVPQGQTQASFDVMAPSTPGLVTITATFGTDTATATLNVM
jgi:hypothetical protein